MKLKHTKKIIFKVNYKDLEKFVSEIYDLYDYSFAAVEECGNDSTHEFNIDGKIDDYDTDDIENILNSKSVNTYQNDLVLNLLCRGGHIEPGTYLISVSW